MHVFLWDLRAADLLSINEHLHLKNYTMKFLYGRMTFSKKSHGLYPADINIFSVKNNKTRLIWQYVASVLRLIRFVRTVLEIIYKALVMELVMFQ